MHYPGVSGISFDTVVRFYQLILYDCLYCTTGESCVTDLLWTSGLWIWVAVWRAGNTIIRSSQLFNLGLPTSVVLVLSYDLIYLWWQTERVSSCHYHCSGS
jgi:hypothetical protein